MIERSVTNLQARRYLLRYHSLAGTQKAGRAGVLAAFERIKSVQYDPLNVVTRNADLVLRARVKDYRPALLDALLYGERALIDGWDKMMCIFPAEEYHRFAPLRAEREKEARGVLCWREQSEALSHLDEVRAYLNVHGAATGAQIPLGGLTRGRWGHSRISSAALDYLFHTVEVLVSSKKGTIKSYDLCERLLSARAQSVEPGFSDEAGFLRWYVQRRVESLGLAWNKNSGGWLGTFLEQKEKRTPALAALLESEQLARIRVEDISEPFYCPAAFLPLFDAGPVQKKVQILAPLDNLLWDRGLVKALFGFSYTWEVYVPKGKRVYGYYVLPLLYGERFLGRFEPAPYRPGAPFSVQNLWLEDGVTLTGAKKAALDAAPGYRQSQSVVFFLQDQKEKGV